MNGELFQSLDTAPNLLKLDQLRASAAAVLPQEVEQFLENRIVHGIEDPLGLLAGVHQAKALQGLEVVRERGTRTSDLLLYITDTGAVVSILDQQSDNVQTNCGGQCLEHVCKILGPFIC